MSHPAEKYFKELHAIRSTGAGTSETSFYPALKTLLDEAGARLKPRVRCISQVADTGAGSPDFGLYNTRTQFQNARDAAPLEGQLPERGVVEVKGVSDKSLATAEGKQVSKYVGKYKQVLVTNYRDFVLVGQDDRGDRTRLESLRLADSEADFWARCAHPRTFAKAAGDRLVDYLGRVMLNPVGLSDPEDVAWFLASYAREARDRIEAVGELPGLAALRKGLEQALGMAFTGDSGEHFFRATLVQTLFYGVFSAWVLWSREGGRGRFNWHEAAWKLHVPMIASLFDQIATPKQLKQFGLDEVLDWTGVVLNRVDRGQFFKKFHEDHAVQYFYEPFLKAYDPELRKQLGVWYTPPEIVKYQVERVDTVLREELGIEDGLADPSVYVLDPACGTGAYLVEVLRKIHDRLVAGGAGGLAGQKLKQAAVSRVFGFEILPAPFVVGHLQLGLLLREFGAPLDGADDERVAVYLTNALTGWEPPRTPKTELIFPEMQQEKDAAEQIKRDKPILVILGNPPYNGFAGLAVDEERDLVSAYRTTQRAPKPEGQGLNDLYVRFFRMAERRIVDKTGKGVVCFISNYAWLEGLSHTGMRERYLEAFDKIWIDCLNGDKYKTGKLTPWGDADPSIFSTESNHEGIQVGTAIALLVRKDSASSTDDVRCESLNFRHLWGKHKHAEIHRNTTGEERAVYEEASPCIELGYPFMPVVVDEGYLTWPLLPDLIPEGFPGVNTARDDGLIDVDLEDLKARMRKYYDPRISNDEIARMSPCLMTSTTSFDAEATRGYLAKRGAGPEEYIRCCYRPFDNRWLCWEPEAKLLDRNRLTYKKSYFPGNPGMILAKRTRKGFEPPFVTSAIASYHVIESVSIVYPQFIRAIHAQGELFEANTESQRANLTDMAIDYLASIGAKQDEFFYHIIAALHAPQYASNNDAALRLDWPRIPLPDDKDRLLASAELGREVAALLDTESPVRGVTCGTLRPELAVMGVPSRVGGGQLAGEDLALTANWGYLARGATMPGSGKVDTRDYTDAERAAIAAGADRCGLTPEQAIAGLGPTCLDVYLNDNACWRCVPEAVWNYTIGGYQVVKKWLSYRDERVLGRALTIDEADYVSETVRRLAALVLLQEALDDNYRDVKASTYPWPG